MLPPSRREFKDIYVVFELMESDLHQVIKANDDLTHEHHHFFLYQMLRVLKYMHTANVYHRDLKLKNILANANCKLKIFDFGLARAAFADTPTTIFWTDYVATRWYRAPELCGAFYLKYTPAVDIWGIGCIFAEVLTGKPLFPGKSVVHQLSLLPIFLAHTGPLKKGAPNQRPQTLQDYVATRWYRAPELCGSFYLKYTPAVDIWGIGCIFSEVLTGKQLFPGKSVVHQLELITGLLGTHRSIKERSSKSKTSITEAKKEDDGENNLNFTLQKMKSAHKKEEHDGENNFLLYRK